MKKDYHITVNKQFDFNLNENDLVNLNIPSLKKDRLHVLVNNTSHKISVTKKDFHAKKYSIKIGSEDYDITLEDNLDLLIKKLGFTLENDSLSNELKAPMPGFILDITATEGQVIKKGDPLVILEAMKMENTLNAPNSGKIKSVHISKGESVEKGTLLIKME